MEEARVSVVTPFYNSVEYLAEAIESVLAQNYRNFEYLLVNNKSTDGSRELAASYAARDPRIRLLDNQEFVNQIDNYNGAFAQISSDSKYVKMVQADDAIFPTCLSEMVKVAESNPRIGLVSSYYLYGNEPWGAGVPYRVSQMTGRDACRLMLLTKQFVVGTPSVVLYRADIIRARKPCFPLQRYHPDTELAYEILLESDFGFVHQILSFARADNDSITPRRRVYNPGILDFLIVIEKYGRSVLSEKEFRELSEREWEYYWSFLGKSALRRRKPDFWEYHRTGLASIGKSIRPGLIAASMVQRAARPLTAFGRKLTERA